MASRRCPAKRAELARSLRKPARPFAAKARLKAEAAAHCLRHARRSPTIPDWWSTALDGAPGIYSARWAGESKDFRHCDGEVEAGLRERDCFQAEQRKAHFVSVLAVAWPDGHVEEFAGTRDGTLVWPPRGSKASATIRCSSPTGFDLTFGEMTPEQKHGLPPKGQGLSHRARAFLKLAEACFGKR
jgi:XTP/dITP diphosphohydrolase